MFIEAITQPLVLVRNANYEGESVQQVGGKLSYFIAIGRIGSFLALYFFFYFISKKENKYLTPLLLLASIVPVLANMSDAGRGEMFRYFYQLVVCMIIFKESILTPKIKIIISLLFIAGFIFIYSVTASRFGKANVFDNILDYLGQNFNNYAYFFDFYSNPTPDKIPPIYMNVFSTFIGSLLSTFGTIGILFFSVIYCFVFFIIFHSTRIAFLKLFMMLYSSDLLLHGIFYCHMKPSSVHLSLIALLLICMCIYIKPQNRIKI